MSSSRIRGVLFATVLHLFVFTSNLVDCVSLEIKDHQKDFTFQAGRTSEIEFNIFNSTCRCETTLYLYKKPISGESTTKSKLVLSETCIKHHGDWNCAAAIVNSRHGYKMWRKFHLQDSDDWVLDVWGEQVQKIISIRVKDTFNGTTEDESDDNFSVLRSKGFILFSLCFNVVYTISIAVVVVTLIVRRQRKFNRSRQSNDVCNEHLYANDITLNAELKSHTAGEQTPGDYLVPVTRPNVYVTSCGMETALDETTTLQPEVTDRRQSTACEEQCEYISLAHELPPPSLSPPSSPPAREDHQPTTLTGKALMPPQPPPPPLPLKPNH